MRQNKAEAEGSSEQGAVRGRKEEREGEEDEN